MRVRKVRFRPLNEAEGSLPHRVLGGQWDSLGLELRLHVRCLHARLKLFVQNVLRLRPLQECPLALGALSDELAPLLVFPLRFNAIQEAVELARLDVATVVLVDRDPKRSELCVRKLRRPHFEAFADALLELVEAQQARGILVDGLEEREPVFAGHDHIDPAVDRGGNALALLCAQTAWAHLKEPIGVSGPLLLRPSRCACGRRVGALDKATEFHRRDAVGVLHIERAP